MPLRLHDSSVRPRRGFSKGRSEPEAAQIALNSFFVLVDFDVQAFHQRSFEIEILSLSAILEDAVGKLADLWSYSESLKIVKFNLIISARCMSSTIHAGEVAILSSAPKNALVAPFRTQNSAINGSSDTNPYQCGWAVRLPRACACVFNRRRTLITNACFLESPLI